MSHYHCPRHGGTCCGCGECDGEEEICCDHCGDVIAYRETVYEIGPKTYCEGCILSGKKRAGMEVYG